MTDPTPHLERFDGYEQAHREFRWKIPRRFNIAEAICRRHADAPTRIALNEEKAAGTNTYTFGALDFLSDKFATALLESGIGPGDSVAVILPQSAAFAVTLFGALKIGALVALLPMTADSALLEHALADSVARALIADATIYNSATAVVLKQPALKSAYVVRDFRPSASGHDRLEFWSEVDRASSDFGAAETDANSAAFIFYVETRGRLTGVVHCHRSLIGRLTAFEMINNLEVGRNSVFWASDDWSSADLVLGMILPAWWYGHSIAAGSLQDQNGVSSFSALYSKPETGCLASDCERWFPKQAGSAGRPSPGRQVEIIDDNGVILPAGKRGRIAVHRSDPALFTRYNNDPERTSAAITRDWFVTDDTGSKDEEGNLYTWALSD